MSLDDRIQRNAQARANYLLMTPEQWKRRRERGTAQAVRRRKAMTAEQKADRQAYDRARYSSFTREQKDFLNAQARRRKAIRKANGFERNFVERWKLAAGCIDCGYNKHPAALDFDHVQGTKIETVSYMVACQRALRTILKEIVKCVVRCANCHRIVTTDRRANEPR